MTREEAIELLVNATYSEEWQGNEKLAKAQHMAIEALQRQSPCDMCENEKEDWWVTCQFCPAEPKGGTER